MDITESTERWDRWVGRNAYDTDGAKLGEVDAIYVDDESGRPEWAAVKTGGHTRLVPLAGALTHRRPDDDPDDEDAKEDLRLAFTAALIDSSPDFEPDEDGHLSPEEETTLYRHYGVHATATRLRLGRIGDRWV